MRPAKEFHLFEKRQASPYVVAKGPNIPEIIEFKEIEKNNKKIEAIYN